MRHLGKCTVLKTSRCAFSGVDPLRLHRALCRRLSVGTPSSFGRLPAGCYCLTQLIETVVPDSPDHNDQPCSGVRCPAFLGLVVLALYKEAKNTFKTQHRQT